jgi:hypothetical protein
MSLKRWFYRGGHPNRVARLLDRGTAAVSARGVGPEYLVALEVPGRRSGRIVSLPLVVATVGGECHLVSMLGEAFKRPGPRSCDAPPVVATRTARPCV